MLVVVEEIAICKPNAPKWQTTNQNAMYENISPLGFKLLIHP